MVKKVLPPLNEQNQIPNIASSGEWKSEDATFLSKLSNGLKMGGEEVVSASEIVSVPDVWARVLIVRNGLIDKRESIAQRIKKALFIIVTAFTTTFVALIPLTGLLGFMGIGAASAGLLKGFAVTTLIGITTGVLISRPAFADIAKQLE